MLPFVNKQTYKITVSYDGTDYYGWQLQIEHVTIAGMLEARFKQVFNHTIRIIGASRTDAGVHALGQVASFSTDLTIDPERMRRAWNGCLPKDIHIRSIELIPGFYALNHVKQKIYWYHFLRVDRFLWERGMACSIDILSILKKCVWFYKFSLERMILELFARMMNVIVRYVLLIVSILSIFPIIKPIVLLYGAQDFCVT